MHRFMSVGTSGFQIFSGGRKESFMELHPTGMSEGMLLQTSMVASGGLSLEKYFRLGGDPPPISGKVVFCSGLLFKFHYLHKFVILP